MSHLGHLRGLARVSLQNLELGLGQLQRRPAVVVQLGEGSAGPDKVSRVSFDGKKLKTFSHNFPHS